MRRYVKEEIIDRAIDPHAKNSPQRLLNLPAVLRFATLHGHSVSTVLPDSPYGTVDRKAAYITVQGRALLAKMQPHPQPEQNDNAYANAAYIDSRHGLPSGIFITVDPDTSDDLLGHLGSCTRESLRVTLMEMIGTLDLDETGSDVRKCSGIVLLNIKPTSRYRRIGSFYHKGEVHSWQLNPEAARRERLDWFKGKAPVVFEIE